MSESKEVIECGRGQEAASRALSSDSLSDWRPIETAPRDGTRVLIYVRSGPWDVIGHGYYFDGSAQNSSSGWISRGFSEPPGELGLAHPTHWMPLPSPPSEERLSSNSAREVQAEPERPNPETPSSSEREAVARMIAEDNVKGWSWDEDASTTEDFEKAVAEQAPFYLKLADAIITLLAERRGVDRGVDQ